MQDLHSSANYADVLKLKTIIDSISAKYISDFPISEVSNFKLGELQTDYNAFVKALQDEELFTRLQPYAPKNIAAVQSISEYKNRISMLCQQLKIVFVSCG
ncbi:MAG: hypothetical protein LBE36_09105 [Flavobacteriaceae bacterium]|jgi:hypothetical protein|nr:hypothetical protein [Flavobacteriaceae bacterium]